MVRRPETQENAGEAVYRASPSSYIAMSLFWWIALLACGFLAFRNPSAPNAWSIVAIVAVLSAAWLAVFRLEIGQGWIKYRSLFGGERTLRDSEIRSVCIPSGAARLAEAHLPPFRMEIVARSGERERRTVTTLKVFARAASKHLRKRLAPFLAS